MTTTTLTRDTVADLIRRSCPSNDPTRWHLQSLRFEGGRVISTDGHRLHRLPAPPRCDLEATVPIWALRAAIESIDGTTGKVRIAAEGDAVRVSTDRGEVRADQPRFVPWQQVCPDVDGRSGPPRLEIELTISDAVREFRRLRKAGDVIVASGLTYAPASEPSREIVRFQAGKMPAAGRPLKDPIAPWDVNAPTWDGQIGWQADYLLDALAAARWAYKLAGAGYAAGKGKVTLRVWEELSPAVISWPSGAAVVMPVRL